MANISEVLLTAIATTLGTGGVAWLSQYLTSRRDWVTQQDRHARYLAIRLVCALDRFVNGCSDVIADHGESGDDDILRPTVKQPDLTLPDDVDWKAIEPSIMYSAMALPIQLENANKMTSYVFMNHSDPPYFEEFFGERQYQFGKLGLAALNLADELRTMFDIPAQDFGVHGWHPREHFENASKSVDEARRQGAMAAAAITARAE